MVKLFLTAASVLSMAAAPAFAQSPKPQRLSLEQITSDVELTKKTYALIHPGYARYATVAQLNTAWDGIITEARTGNGMNQGDFYLAMQKALTLIRCDHTKAELPKALRTERNNVPVYLPLRWQMIEGRGLISIPPAETVIERGDEIIAIDGRPLKELISEVETYIPYDGNTVWARIGGIGESLEFMGGAIDHFGALLWNVERTAKLDIKTTSGELKSVTVDRITFDAWKKYGDSKANMRNFKDAVSYERIGKIAGYLKVDTFVNYRDPIKPDKLFDPIFKSIKQEGRAFLILDLRENGGGSTDAQMRLIAHLISEPLKATKDMRVATLNLDAVREHLSTWDKRALKPNPIGFKKNSDGTYSLRSFVDDDLKVIKPDKSYFEGTLIILTSGSNSSGSTNLSATLRSHSDAVLIGERTGGSAEGPTAGLLFTLTLPESGIRTRVPFFRYYNNVESFEPGMGVSPDIEAPMTAAAYLAGNDPAYDAALAYIADQQN